MVAELLFEVIKMKKDIAFSGLEAAIVLIAFVVVAAVFSYVMLGAGFFATQKSQEVTYAGIKQTTSNLILDGQIYGTMSGADLDILEFTLAIPEGGQAQDVSDDGGALTILYSYTTDGTTWSDATPLSWTATNPITGVAGVTTLNAGDKVDIATDVALGGPPAGYSFTLEIKPLVGASTLITKTLSTGYEGGPIL